MKIEYNAAISKLEKEIGNVDDDRENIEYLTNKGLENLLKLGLDSFNILIWMSCWGLTRIWI